MHQEIPRKKAYTKGIEIVGALHPGHGNSSLREIHENLMDVKLVKHAPLLSQAKRNP